jgi:hypothetical protein
MNAFEARKIADTNATPVEYLVGEYIKDIDSWIDSAVKYGRYRYIWLCTDTVTEQQIQEVISHFRCKGFEIESSGEPGLRFVTFHW